MIDQKKTVKRNINVSQEGRGQQRGHTVFTSLPEVEVNHKTQSYTTEEVEHSQQRRKHDTTCPPRHRRKRSTPVKGI